MTNKLPVGWDECKLEEICCLDNGNKQQGLNLPLLDAKFLRGKKDPEYKNSGAVLDSND